MGWGCKKVVCKILVWNKVVYVEFVLQKVIHLV